MSRQFQALYRQFLFRITDVEALSARAQGDTNKLFGQIAALLLFISLLCSLPGLGLAGADSPPLFVLWSMEHFLIATTMLTVGVLAVLSWDSAFPDHRDVFVLSPLPVRPREILLARAAAVGTALCLSIAVLHALTGIIWPFALSGGDTGRYVPTWTAERALPPLRGDELETVLNADFADALREGALAPQNGLGLVIGITENGTRRVLSYGAADPSAVFEIGSLTKPLTGLLLAEMVSRQEVRLNDPLRQVLLGAARSPSDREITLLDLATHHSGLPAMPANFDASDVTDSYLNYDATKLREYLSRQRLETSADPSFTYSNLGFSVLGQAMADRAGESYADLLENRVFAPLGMRDTAIALSPSLESRFIPGHNPRRAVVSNWELNAFAPAGGVRSTASDMLTFLEANLNPPDALAPAIEQTHVVQREAAEGLQIGLAWLYDPESGTYWHNGATRGYSSYAFFNPVEGYGAIVLSNIRPPSSVSGDLVGGHVRSRMSGDRAIAIEDALMPPNSGVLGFARVFAAYWTTMLCAGTFVYCCVLALQGLASQLLPWTWFLRISPYLQMAVFGVILAAYFLQPTAVTPAALIEAQGTGMPAWSPSYWFLGLFQYLIGSSMLAPLALRAQAALALALSLAGAAYLLSFTRTLRRIAEHPDIVPTTAGFVWAPNLGGRPRAALRQFSVRTLLRSRPHRAVLAFFLGVGFAVMTVYLKIPETQGIAAPTAGGPWGQPTVQVLGATVLLLGFAVVGVRMAFSLPRDLRANWIFRVTPTPNAGSVRATQRRSLLLLAVLPTWLATAVPLLWLWHWTEAVGHLAVLGLLGVILVELSLQGPPRMPFACSYLPGRSNIHITFWLCVVGILRIVALGAELELDALRDPPVLGYYLGGLGLVALAARWRSAAAARAEGEETSFEAAGGDELVRLEIG